jgi:hypothetical protein
MGIISPYATGPAPIYYGCGYISRTDFWKLGLIFGIVFVAALLIIGHMTQDDSRRVHHGWQPFLKGRDNRRIDDPGCLPSRMIAATDEQQQD